MVDRTYLLILALLVVSFAYIHLILTVLDRI